jgi:hypothetical protein
VRPDDPNLPNLRAIASALGPLRDRFVFIGGATAGLLVTDPAAALVRATKDVDAIVEAGLADFHRIAAQLAERGFVHDVESGVICRWRHRESRLAFDLMPVDPAVLGFSNRWYRYVLDSAERVDLGDGMTVRLVTAPAFVATKLDAFADRGNGDILASHDLEDILNIVDGRAELTAELRAAPLDVTQAIRNAIGQLLAHPDFPNALPGLIADPNRVDIVIQRLRALAALSPDSLQRALSAER